MNIGFILVALILIPVVQVAHAQGLTDSINSAVENNIGKTFDSINQASNSNSSSPALGNDNDNGSQTTTTTTTTSGPGNSNSTTTTMKTENK